MNVCLADVIRRSVISFMEVFFVFLHMSWNETRSVKVSRVLLAILVVVASACNRTIKQRKLRS